MFNPRTEEAIGHCVEIEKEGMKHQGRISKI